MVCPRCGAKMQISAHRPHKKEKWVCPRCRKVRMKSQRERKFSKRSYEME